MAKWLLPLGIILGCVCAFVLVRSLKSGFGKNPNSSAPSQQQQQRSMFAPAKNEKQAAYIIYSEHLETWNPLDYVLETVEGGWYALGEMSSKGYVVAVSPKRAKIITPDGHTAWIVAMRHEPLSTPESQSGRGKIASAEASEASGRGAQ